MREMEIHQVRAMTRRHFFSDCRVGLGAIALGSLLNGTGAWAGTRVMAPSAGHFPPKAKRVVYMHMAGGPSQIDLFDPKPRLKEFDGQSPPESLVKGKRFAFLKPDAKLLASARTFKQWGRSGAVIGDLLPHLGGVADEVCFIKGMVTEVFNHGPAKVFMNTGSPQAGRPAMGSWVTYGIGSEADNLPGFVVLLSGPRGPRSGAQLWSSGFLPTTYQGVPFRSGAEPILNLKNPAGFDEARQAEFFDAVGDLNKMRLGAVADPEIATRIAAYEMAYRMQSSAPELVDISSEPKHVLEMYGAKAGEASFANNCLLARRLLERGTRFVQLYHTDWDHHGDANLNLGKPLDMICRQIDQGAAALVRDLKQRGMLEDTIVIFGGEFGRTPMGEQRAVLGRDHHIESFTMWVAGGGFKAGHTHGVTDELGFGVTEGKVHVHDLQATILHLLGLNHEKLTFRFQGRDYRLTDIAGEVVHDILA